MSTLRHRVARLERLTRCPQHPDQPLLCADCDPRSQSAAEWHELAQLLQQAGYLEPLEHAPVESLGRCWGCGADALVCLLCLSDRDAPPGVDRLDGEALARLYALGAKLLPPWLEDTGGPYDGHAP